MTEEGIIIKKQPLDIIENMYTDHYIYLRNYLLGLTKSHQEADDVIQELFSKILRNPPKVLEVEHVQGWLLKSARNTLLNFYKRKRPVLLKEEEMLETLLISNNSVEDEVMVTQQLDTYLEGMTKTDQAIFIAKEYYGYTYDEISDMLQITVPTLKSRIFRIRKNAIRKRGD